MILGGATGLLGQAMVKAAAAAGYEVTASARNDFDPVDSESVTAFVNAHNPDIICNTIAYTQVDKAEGEEEEALALNRLFPLILGRIVKERPSVYLMHISTDFVFNGRKREPYLETDETDPQCVYGRSKREGELALLNLKLEKCCIVRTAWLFGPGRKNFITTMLDLCRQGKPLSVVHDQTGCPTYTVDLAAYCLKLLETGGQGIFHVVNGGKASWCELAQEAIRLAQLECQVTPITSGEYPQKACRPAFSVLDTAKFTTLTGITPRPWPQALADYIFSIADQE